LVGVIPQVAIVFLLMSLNLLVRFAINLLIIVFVLNVLVAGR
jgi:hypothetical protein